ncbi:transmembrane protein 231 [Anabrus simplex]|uniref:transmembrane protein 231 n=1 Tax=Anabrus simplex TaxID=316456 RepID=UPI0034DCEA30
MAVYEAFSYNVVYKHRSTLCSNTTVFLILSALITVIGPFLLAYRSHGFWLKTETYREQPDVLYKHQYIVVVETDHLDTPILCSTFPNLNNFLRDRGLCSLVKSREEDHNNDGRRDELHIEFELSIHNYKAVHSVRLFLLFDYKLRKICSLQMESLGVIQHSASLPGARFDVVADLRLVQKQPLQYRRRDLRYNSSVINAESIFPESFNFQAILLEYAKRNVSTRLGNVYPVWTSGRAADVPFIISATIHYPEETITYIPGFWQVMKWAWIQYLSILIIFIHVFRSIKTYVFSNQLVSSVKEVPWKKVM